MTVISDVDRLYAARWPNGRKSWPLAESQLSWARLNINKFRDYERAARAVQRETEQSRERLEAATRAASAGDLGPVAEIEEE